LLKAAEKNQNGVLFPTKVGKAKRLPVGNRGVPALQTACRKGKIDQLRKKNGCERGLESYRAWGSKHGQLKNGRWGGGKKGKVTGMSEEGEGGGKNFGFQTADREKNRGKTKAEGSIELNAVPEKGRFGGTNAKVGFAFLIKTQSDLGVYAVGTRAWVEREGVERSRQGHGWRRTQRNKSRWAEGF